MGEWLWDGSHRRGVAISAAIHCKWDGVKGAVIEGFPLPEIWHRYPRLN